VVDDDLSVQLDRHPSAQQCDIEDLPLSRRPGGIFRRRDV
jgi:hypothetical protein